MIYIPICVLRYYNEDRKNINTDREEPTLLCMPTSHAFGNKTSTPPFLNQAITHRDACKSAAEWTMEHISNCGSLFL